MFGAVGMRAFLHSRIPRSDQHTMEAARAVPIARLTTELQLTPDQQKAVMRQLDEYGKYYQNIEDERADVARHGIQAILDCLDQDQQKRFAKMFQAKR